MSNAVTLGWPPKELSPNARTHWATKAKAARLYRAACHVLARDAGIKAPSDGRIHVWIDFYPPNRRSRDDDNLIAAFKPGRDGLADAMNVDDKRFQIHPRIMQEIGGYIKVRLTATIEEGSTA